MFVKGKSGNPGGRPKGWQDVQAAARAHTPAAIKTLVDALTDEKLCVQAATALLDRGWGRPTQHVDVTRRTVDDIPEEVVDAAIEALDAASRSETARGDAATAGRAGGEEPPVSIPSVH